MKKWLTLLAAPLLLLGRSAQAQSVAGPPTNLTPGSYTEDFAARLSPNGSRVLFTAAKGERNASFRYHDVYVLNTDGTPITDGIYQIALQSRVYYPGFDEWGSFAPDNNTVVLSDTYDYTRDPRSLYKVTVDPFLSTNLTDNFINGMTDAFPAFNSTGTMIAFVSNRATGIGQPMQLFAMKPQKEEDGNYPFQLTNWTDGEAAMPVGTPDGKMFVLKKISDTVQELFRVDLKDTNNDGEGDNLVQITNFGKWITSPSQPVAGGKIFFQMAGKDNRPHVFSMDANGTNVHQVTGANYNEETPSVAGGKLVLTATDPKNGSWNQDVYLYTLDTTTGNGTVTGTYVNAGGAPQAGTTVNAYDGDTLKGTATTDANGVYTLTLPAGGYTLEFITTTPDSWTQLRSVSVSVGKTTTENAFTTPKAANRPRGTIATIKDSTVVVRWAPASGTPTGYNVYRATSEAGPYTKITATPVAPTAPLMYTDAAPGNLASVFYKVTAVHDAGESAFTEISQAANNLIFNGSFDLVDGEGNPIGWVYGTWGGDGTGGTTTTHKVDGARSAYLKTGDTGRSAQFFHSDPAFYPPTMPGVAMVEGMWAKFTDTQSTWPIAVRQAPWEAGYGYIPWWYPETPSRGPGLGPWDTNGLTNGGGDSAWTWVYNTDGIQEWEFTEGTRMSFFWANDGLTTLGLSTAYGDDLTWQAQRFGATGWVMGTIRDTKGNTPTGVKVSVGGQTINTDGSAQFIVKDVPTGPQTLTIEAPGMTPWTKNIGVYGGYRLQEIVVVPAVSNLQITGTVKDQQGNPIAGADVRLVTFAAATIRDNIWPDGEEKQTFTTTTDASGNYKFDSTVTDGVAHSGATAIIAHKNGYVSRNIAKVFGLTGNSTGNDITLTSPNLILEVLKTTTPPTIDGVYNAAEWAGSQVFELDRKGGGGTPSVKTTGYAKWDNDNVYFAFIAEEPNPTVIVDPNLNDPTVPPGIVVTAHSNDSAMWGTDPYWNGDDLIEFRIDQLNGAEIGMGYEWWQFLMNTINVVTDIEWRRAGGVAPLPVGQMWGLGSNSGTVTSVNIDTAGKKWTMEVQVPFSGLVTTAGTGGVTPTAGQTEWYMTIGRQRHQPHPVGEPMGLGNAIVRFVTSLTPPVKGDLNGDRQVTAADVAIANRIAAGLEALGSRLSRGDINGDGKVDGIDATRILRKVNGLDTF